MHKKIISLFSMTLGLTVAVAAGKGVQGASLTYIVLSKQY